MKKAQGISLNVIIIAAIALLVLVILSVVLMGRMGTFTRVSGGTDFCVNTLGGECKASCDIGEVKANVCDKGEACCVPVKGMIQEGK